MVGEEGDPEEVESLGVGDVAKLGQAVWDALAEDGPLLVVPTHFLVRSMSKVIYADDGFFLSPQQPHTLVCSKHPLAIDADIVLFHGFAVGVGALPDFAVAVVEDSVVPGFRERVVGESGSHYCFYWISNNLNGGVGVWVQVYCLILHLYYPCNPIIRC